MTGPIKVAIESRVDLSMNIDDEDSLKIFKTEESCELVTVRGLYESIA